MSAAIAERLHEIVERSEERRRRVSEIRRQSAELVDIAQELRFDREPRVGFDDRRFAPADALECEPDEPAFEEAGPSAPDGVLDQVQRLLQEIAVRERDEWTDEDALILACLQGALAAATRKGYTLQELRAVLEALGSLDRYVG